MSSKPKLNINSLYNIHRNNLSIKTETFYEILVKCHEKIARHNKEYKQLECLYRPPVTLYGRPMYNYQELILFIIDQLQENGLKSFWSSKDKAIYISWKPEDVTIPYDDDEETTGCSYDEYNNDEPSMEFLQIETSGSGIGRGGGKKSKKDPPKSIQHVALVNYGGAINDMIPVSLKK